jgi:DNA-directed RNA polymerase I, II, and III subunit RPABC2
LRATGILTVHGSYDYEPDQTYDDIEPEDFLNPEDIEGEEGAEGYEGGYGGAVNGDRVVVSGDPNAGYSGKVVEQARAKKIPNDQRTTTPYMTKYERARVLGTRALQIRFVCG